MISKPPLWKSTHLQELLDYASSKYQIEFAPVSAGGITLQIAQIANMREILDTVIQTNGLDSAITTLPLWAKIWPASLILGHYLRHNNLETLEVLEVGAGCGVTGLVAGALGAKQVYITDINEDALIFAQINVLTNKLENTVQVEKLDIASDKLNKRFPLIIGAEILYLEHLYKPLIKFLANHLSPVSATVPTPEVIFATDHRRNAKYFFKLAEKHYTVSHKHIGAKETDETGNGEKHLLTLHRLTPFGSKKM